MNRERPSNPPVSLARPTSERLTSERLAAERLAAEQSAARWQSMREGVKSYRDDALLERVQVRLDAIAIATRPAHAEVVWRAAAALVLFGVGVGVGLGLPSLTGRTVQPELARATAELARTGAAEATRARPLERRDTAVRPPPRRAQKKRVLPSVVPPDEGITLLPLDGAETVDLEVAETSGPNAPSVRSTWLEFADAGDYPSALAELERSQVAHLVLATGSVEELMTMAEVARFAGNQERAIQALSQVVDRYAGDPNAPLAAMMLGNLLSRSGDSAGAARAFALNRTLSPGGDFAEDSLGREFDLALAAGNAKVAASLFDQYAREFPAGPRLYAMRYELDELVAEKAAEKVAEKGTTDSEPGAPTAEAPSDAVRADGARTDEHADSAPPAGGEND